jgi:hypothetical protein
MSNCSATLLVLGICDWSSFCSFIYLTWDDLCFIMLLAVNMNLWSHDSSILLLGWQVASGSISNWMFFQRCNIAVLARKCSRLWWNCDLFWMCMKLHAGNVMNLSRKYHALWWEAVVTLLLKLHWASRPSEKWKLCIKLLTKCCCGEI